MKRGAIFGGILAFALAAFELFNFSTTDFALTDFLGDERFLGIRWATILAIAFCGIDFAGLARLFTPERDDGEPVEVWYLLGAWFLGATLNAMATWWAVTLALLEHEIGNEVLTRAQVLAYVPLLVAALVWLTRILIIGTFSVAGERLFSQAEKTIREAQQAMSLAGHPVAPARIIGQGEPVRSDHGARGAPAAQPTPARPSLNQRPRIPGAASPPQARPAPKPSAASKLPQAGFRGDVPSEHEELPVDEGLSRFASRPAVSGLGRPTNGANGPKKLE